MRYLPSEPLLDAARGGRPWHLTVDCPRCENGANRQRLCATSSSVGAALGVARTRVEKWRAGGQVPVKDAEGLASRLGLLDIEVWPELLETVERVCVCGERFVPRHTGHRSCSPRCAKRVWRDANPDRESAIRRAGYRRNGEQRREERRRRYRENPRAELLKQRIRDRKRREAA